MHPKTVPPTHKHPAVAHSLVSHPLHASARYPVRIIFAVAPCSVHGHNVAAQHMEQSHLPPGASHWQSPDDQFPGPFWPGTGGRCCPPMAMGCAWPYMGWPCTGCP
eukprot:CAMPEP_0119207616 /NCGR_PEP_ID=MMETSP1327-20130426/74_1 /TAXON_ID=38833 /ORGANISM="Micromonas pusilla, Strain RCC2306" /LENGTH=105 /DNA_ID=CAMNT_0007204025 /DNA_START=381 /DNA_END=698 /DNA_ORIENTATION=+